MVDTGTGTLYIIGSFKRMTTDPDFKVSTCTQLDALLISGLIRVFDLRR